MKYRVFNVDFDGIDKCGKDTLQQTMTRFYSNVCIYNARGILSQLAYAKMFGRDAEYLYTPGYMQNTLIVYLTLDEDDWNVRCDLAHEKEVSAGRSDVEGKIDYKTSCEAFEWAWSKLCSDSSIDKRNLMKFNTSDVTPVQIARQVKARIQELNGQD